MHPQLLPQTAVSELARLRLVLDCNSHQFGVESQDVGCFPDVAVGLNHSCDANADVEIDRDHLIVVHAARDIERGEEVAQCYIGEVLLRGEDGSIFRLSCADYHLLWSQAVSHSDAVRHRSPCSPHPTQS